MIGDGDRARGVSRPAASAADSVVDLAAARKAEPARESARAAAAADRLGEDTVLLTPCALILSKLSTVTSAPAPPPPPAPPPTVDFASPPRLTFAAAAKPPAPPPPPIDCAMTP